MTTGSFMTPIYSRSQSEVLGVLHKLTLEKQIDRTKRVVIVVSFLIFAAKFELQTRYPIILTTENWMYMKCD
ncbi:hypothetical protein TNCV_3948141 [Trichonephila clavipes]|nr:hypothetical protein TNCV_3948141 [Trichonephila clavipes]